MKALNKIKNPISSVIIHLILVVSVILMTTPFWWMISTSLKTKQEILRFPPTWIPEIITYENYRELLTLIDFITPLKNSILIAVITTALSLVVCSMAAYAIAKFEFRFKNKIFILMLATLMIPGQVTTIPMFLLMKNMGLLDTYTGLISVGIVSVGNIFFFRQFLITISSHYIEAARIDGAGDVYIFFRIILPMMKPALITMGIFSFTGAWNSFFWPLIVAVDDSFYTLPLAMTILDGQHSGNIGLNMAGALIVIFPLLMLFIAAQKHVIQSINLSGLKE